jgi:hypothetical protein
MVAGIADWSICWCSILWNLQWAVVVMTAALVVGEVMWVLQ